MLYLVQVPGRRKRIQQNAESPQEAIAIIYNNLTAALRNGSRIEDCTAEECPDPMDQFYKGRTHAV